jgi:hypothetical protein
LKLVAAVLGPTIRLLAAFTVTVYAVLTVSPVTIIGEVAPVATKLPGLTVTVYSVIDSPPFCEGAVKDTDTWVGVGNNVVIVGVFGAPNQLLVVFNNATSVTDAAMPVVDAVTVFAVPIIP